MDCKHARLLLEVAHPIATELDARDKEQLAAHLADCPECGAWAESERLSDEQIGAAMRDVPVPDGFKLRLLNRLGNERDAWYRGWAVRGMGVAAALLITVFLGYGFWSSRRPAPDWERLTADINEMAYSPETVEQDFAKKGITLTAPPRFDYTGLAAYGMADFQGKKVPYLTFIHRGTGDKDKPALATVYVLSDRQFNLDVTRNRPPPASGRSSIQLLAAPDNPHILYVAVVWDLEGRRFEDVFYRRLAQGNLN